MIRPDLPEKQIEDLNAGKAIFVEGMQRKDGEVFSSYVKLDEATGRPSYTRYNPDSPEGAREIYIPNEINGVKISLEEQQQLVTADGDRYTITDKGRKVAQELAYDLPRSVREKAVAAVLRSQTWARKEAEYSARISEKADGHCSVRCQVKALDSELFCLDIGTPDRLSAEMVKKQFILKGNEIYQMLITKLTEEEK